VTFDTATFDVASYSFSYYELGFIAIAAILVGAAKTGVQGAAMISVPLLALVFGAKESTGVMLPIMILADVFAIYYYHQHANWRDLKSLIPFALIGVVIGTVLGQLMNGHVFSYAMVVIQCVYRKSSLLLQLRGSFLLLIYQKCHFMCLFGKLFHGQVLVLVWLPCR